MAFQLLAQLSNNAKDLMTSGRGDTVTTPLTEENTHIISLGVEKGDRDLTEDTTNTNNDQSWRVTQKSLIRRHLFDLIALVVLLVIVAVLFVLLQVVRRDNGVSENNAITVDDSWFNSPPTSFETNIPVQAPTRAPIEPFEPSVFPPQIQSNTPTFPSINEQILKVFDESKIADPTTPLGRAYQWIQKEDDASPLQTYPTIVQRFVLAAFYFSTGGGRTSTTWSVCGAVPANPVQGGDGVALRCVFDTDDRTDVICAQPIDFLECPEYYEKYNVTRPKNPRKKRWLSESSECDWYGITCNAQGQVVQMSLPSNGLIGPLLEDLHILSEIRFLNLDDNNFAGALPDWENFHLIEDLMISNSKLEGMIPQGWKTWRRLKTLAISDNGMDGPLILPGDWSELDTIFAGDNNFDIAIRPKIGDLTGLRSLELGGNDLVSSIPRSIGQLTNLRLLDLSRGQMTGSLPSEIGQLTQLGKYPVDHTLCAAHYKFTQRCLQLNCNSRTIGSVAHYPKSFGYYRTCKHYGWGRTEYLGAYHAKLVN